MISLCADFTSAEEHGKGKGCKGFSPFHAPLAKVKSAHRLGMLC